MTNWLGCSWLGSAKIMTSSASFRDRHGITCRMDQGDILDRDASFHDRHGITCRLDQGDILDRDFALTGFVLLNQLCCDEAYLENS